MFKIMGRYQGRKETIDTFTSRKEAIRCLGEYRLAFGAGWVLWLVDTKTGDTIE